MTLLVPNNGEGDGQVSGISARLKGKAFAVGGGSGLLSGSSARLKEKLPAGSYSGAQSSGAATTSHYSASPTSSQAARTQWAGFRGKDRRRR